MSDDLPTSRGSHTSQENLNVLPGIPRLVSDGPSGIWPEDVVTNPTSGAEGLLSNIRVIESSLLGPGHVATFFADLGADVIKVESRPVITSGR